MPSPIPRSLIAQDDPLWGETKRDPPEGGSIPGRLGVRARTPRPRGCTFLRVFNNSPSRDRSWCTVLTGGPFRGPFFRFSGGGNVPPLGGEKWPPRGPLFHPPTKGPKRPPNGPPKRPRNHPPTPSGGMGVPIQQPSDSYRHRRSERARYTTHLHVRCQSNVVPTQRVRTIDAHRRCSIYTPTGGILQPIRDDEHSSSNNGCHRSSDSDMHLGA